MTAAPWLALAVGVLGALLNLGALVLAAGKLVASLDTVKGRQEEHRAESRAQHEETRREIAALREGRVQLAADVGHHASELARHAGELQRALEEIKELRHDLRAVAQDVAIQRAALDSAGVRAPNARRVPSGEG